MSDPVTNTLPDDVPTLALLEHAIAVFEGFVRDVPREAFNPWVALDVIADARWALAVASGQPTDIVPRFRRTPEISLSEIFGELDFLLLLLLRFHRGRNVWPFRAARRQAIDLLGVTPKLFKKITTPRQRRVKS